jgi:hypothetical protein
VSLLRPVRAYHPWQRHPGAFMFRTAQRFSAPLAPVGNTLSCHRYPVPGERELSTPSPKAHIPAASGTGWPCISWHPPTPARHSPQGDHFEAPVATLASRLRLAAHSASVHHPHAGLDERERVDLIAAWVPDRARTRSRGFHGSIDWRRIGGTRETCSCPPVCQRANVEAHERKSAPIHGPAPFINWRDAFVVRRRAPRDQSGVGRYLKSQHRRSNHLSSRPIPHPENRS